MRTAHRPAAHAAVGAAREDLAAVQQQRMHYFQSSDFEWTVSHHLVAKPTISTSSVVSAQQSDDRNFHWVYNMRKQAPAARSAC